MHTKRRQIQQVMGLVGVRNQITGTKPQHECIRREESETVQLSKEKSQEKREKRKRRKESGKRWFRKT